MNDSKLKERNAKLESAAFRLQESIVLLMAILPKKDLRTRNDAYAAFLMCLAEIHTDVENALKAEQE